MRASPVRVLVVDGHRAFADGVRLLLGADEDIEVIGSAGDVAEAERIAAAEPPDVVLLDLGLTGDPVRDAVAGLSPARVVAVAEGPDPDTVVRALGSGACGVVSKTEPLERLADVVHQAASGEIVVAAADLPMVFERLQASRAARVEGSVGISSLTERETQILRELAGGESTSAVATRLGISRLTVQSHVKNILAKLGVHSKLEAITIAWRHGVVDAERSA
ncbi:MAG TPA: response regulator transcription factor [Actinomycetota bacterium]|nr:response regulator transcription factor [Actinomycetota bacterium]